MARACRFCGVRLSLLWPGLALSDPRPAVGALQLSGAYGGRTLRSTPMAAAAGSTKAMALVKRTLVLSPVAAPKTPGSPPRGCSWPPTAWPFKDWSRARSPAASCLPQPHSCSTSATAVCLLFPQDSLSSSLKTCYKYLNQTSRSFAAVIQALDGDIRLVESPDLGRTAFPGSFEALQLLTHHIELWAPCCGLGRTTSPHSAHVFTCKCPSRHLAIYQRPFRPALSEKGVGQPC